MIPLKNARVFVSGGAGVIGSYLVEHLVKLGANIFVGDLKPKPKNWPQAIEYYEGDLNSISQEELLEFRPDYYFHLAATFERSEESFDFWKENFHHNITLSHHLMDCLKNSKTLKRVIFASSYLIYDPKLYLFAEPSKKTVSLKESAVQAPRNLCGMAKLLHEQELAFLQKFNQNGFTTISARIYRSYGRNSRDILSRWIRSLLNKEKITVYRKEGVFDFIYAEDVALGLIALAQINQSGVVNLGRGRGRKISEVLDVLKKYFPDMAMEEAESSIPYEASEADMSLFQSLTGFLPKNDLETTIPFLIKFIQS